MITQCPSLPDGDPCEGKMELLCPPDPHTKWKKDQARRIAVKKKKVTVKQNRNKQCCFFCGESWLGAGPVPTGSGGSKPQSPRD